MRLLQLLLMSACVLALPVQAELYKYVDDNGRVTYTDRKPEQQDAIALDDIPEPEKRTRFAYEAIERPLHQDFHRVLVLYPELAWAGDESNRRQIGVFRFGKSCGSPTSMLWPEVTYSHRSMLASSGDMSAAIGKKLGLLGYKYATQYSGNLHRQLERFQGYILKATLMDLEVDACADNTTRTYRDQSLERFAVSAFRKNKVSVTVKWQLYADMGAEPVAELETRGYSDSLKQPAYMQSVMQDAVVNSLEGFFAEPSVVEHLVVKEAVETAAERKPVPPPQEERSMLEQWLQTLEALWRGSGLDPLKGANVLSDLQRAKVMVFSDLAENGEVSDELLAALARQHWSDTVSAVDVAFDGTINLQINGEPGEDLYLRYYPTDDTLDFAGWVCETNLPESWFPTGLNCPLVK